MKRSIRIFSILLVLLMLCAAFASCSSASKGDLYAPEEENAAGSLGNGFDASTPTSKPVVADRKVIKTFELYAETTDFSAAQEALDALIAEHGAYVESSSVSDQSLKSKNSAYARRASYTVRVPAENAEAFVGALGGRFNVTSNTSRVQDISDTYYSIEARLEELKVERDSLLDILAAPETEKDYDLWLTVHQRLSEVKQQIAVYQGQLNRYDGQVAYSTVNLTVVEVINLTVKTEDNGFFARLWAATKKGWTAFFSVLQWLVIALAAALPFLIVLGVIVLAIALVLRGVLRHERKKREAAKRRLAEKTPTDTQIF